MNNNFSTLSERLMLPSRGLIYPESWNVRNGVYIKPLRVKDLKGLLNSPNNYNIDFVIKNCLNGEYNIDLNKMISFDKEELILRIVSVSGLSPFKCSYICANEACNKTTEIIWDVDKFETIYLKDCVYPFEVVLPESKIKVAIKYLTDIDLEYIYNKLDIDFDNYFYYNENNTKEFCIQSIYKIENIEIKNRNIKEKFYFSLSAYDSYYFEEFYKSIVIGPKPVQNYECPECGARYEIRYPVDVRLFCCNPNSEKGTEINNKTYRMLLSEQMDLAEFGHVSISESDNMYVFEKDAIYNLLFDRLDKRNKEIEKSRGNAAV